MICKIENGEVSTDRLYLRKFREEDLDNYAKIMSSDDIGRWLPKGKGFTREETLRMMKRFIEHWDKYGFGVWAVTDGESGKLMGHCGLNTIEITKEVEVLYALYPDFWGKGYATEAALASCEYALNHLKMDRIIALSKPDNDRSRNVIEKSGFKFIDYRQYFNMECAYYERK